MQGTTLTTFLPRATVYERWRAPLDRKLRVLALASAPVILICLAPLFPVLTDHLRSQVASLPVGDPALSSVRLLQWLLCLVTALDLIGLALYVPMLVATDCLKEARPHWHWVAFAEAILGAFHGFFLALAVAAVVIVAAFWLLMMALLAVAAVVGLFGLALGAGN